MKEKFLYILYYILAEIYKNGIYRTWSIGLKLKDALPITSQMFVQHCSNIKELQAPQHFS